MAFYSADIASQYANIKDDSLLVLGNKVYRQGNYAESETIYRKALKKYSDNKNSDEWIITSIGIGASLLDQGDLLNGKKWMLKADSSISTQTPLELQAYVKSNMGWVYKSFQKYPEAYKHYNLALSLAKKSGDQYRIAQVSNSLSLLTYLLGYYDEAINYAQIAVYNFELIEDPFLLSMSYGNLSTAFEALGFTQKAEENLLKSLNLKYELQNEDLVTTAHYYLGSFYHRTGNYDKALTNYSKYLSYVLEVGEIGFITPAYDYVGSVYLSLGEFEKALEYFSSSQKLDEQHNLQGNASTILNIAFCYQKLGEVELAKTLYKKALNEFIEKEDHHQVIDTYLKLSELELDLKNINEAFSLAEKALTLSLKTESKQLKAKSYATLGKINLELGNNEEALELSKRAYGIASVFKGYSLATYSINLATAFYETENDSAFYYAELAFEEIEAEQRNIYGDNLEAGLFSKYAKFYDLVSLWYLDRKEDLSKAFETTERGRSRVLLERLTFSDQQLNAILDESTLLTVRQKERNIDELYRKIENASDKSETDFLKDELRNAEFEYQSFTNELRLNNANLDEIYSLSSISVSELQDKMTKKDALIEYMVADNKLVSFIITKKESSFEVFEFDSTLTQEAFLTDNISSFRTAIQDQKSIDSLEILSRSFIELLIEPVSQKHPSITQLILVPTHSLSILPFDALYSNDEFLIEIYNIKYLPSSSIYKYIKEPHRETSKEILAVAGSGFNSNNSNNAVESQEDFASLPSTLLEVDAISNVFGDHTILKNEQVTESRIKSLSLNNFRYLHFATHGNVHEANPQQSGLIISKMNSLENSLGEDGYLNSLEISNLTLNADLVVLSACNTAIGKLIGGEGLLGLQRSFFQAGASSVIVSLWNVYDKSTSVLMGDFYQKLSDYEESEIGFWTRTKMYFNAYEAPFFGYKENALRDAKLALLDHPYYNHPVNWAPFIMIGK